MVATNTLAAYDAIAPLYAEYSEKYQHYLNAVDQLVIDRLDADMCLLDVGSGDGRRLKKITDTHALTDVISVEPSEKMAAICKQTTSFTVHNVCADQINTLKEGPFDVITALWNVFGHMENSNLRLTALKNMAAKLKPDGIMMLDVNNRHNQMAYGRWNVTKRRIIDAVAFNETRGDAYYNWEIAGQSFPASGHLFTPSEMQNLFDMTGLRVSERYSVNYRTGGVSISPFNGQLFYVLEKT